MKESYIAIAALTGSCALLYLLYQYRKSIRERPRNTECTGNVTEHAKDFSKYISSDNISADFMKDADINASRTDDKSSTETVNVEQINGHSKDSLVEASFLNRTDINHLEIESLQDNSNTSSMERPLSIVEYCDTEAASTYTDGKLTEVKLGSAYHTDANNTCSDNSLIQNNVVEVSYQDKCITEETYDTSAENSNIGLIATTSAKGKSTSDRINSNFNSDNDVNQTEEIYSIGAFCKRVKDEFGSSSAKELSEREIQGNSLVGTSARVTEGIPDNGNVNYNSEANNGTGISETSYAYTEHPITSLVKLETHTSPSAVIMSEPECVLLQSYTSTTNCDNVSQVSVCADTTYTTEHDINSSLNHPIIGRSTDDSSITLSCDQTSGIPCTNLCDTATLLGQTRETEKIISEEACNMPANDITGDNKVNENLTTNIKSTHLCKTDESNLYDCDKNVKSNDLCTKTQEPVSHSTENLDGTTSVTGTSKNDDKSSSVRSKRQRKREKRNVAGNESKNSSNSPTSDNKETLSEVAKSVSSSENKQEEVCVQVAESQKKGDSCSSSVEARLEAAALNHNLHSGQEPTCTSDLEREATPDQDNGASDSQSLISQGSFDSGQGSIEVEPETVFCNSTLRTKPNDQYIFYQFEVPQFLVGRLIGRKGAFINKVKAATQVSIIVLDHSNRALKLCSVEGNRSQVIKALELVRQHFPLDQFPDITLAQVNSPTPSPQHQPQMNRQVLQVELPPGVVVEVQASAIVSTGEVWLQQPLHPTFSALQRLHECMNLNYGDGTTTPAVPLPIQTNTVCVCQIGSQWLRCQVMDHSELTCTVTILDIGSIVNIPVGALRQIRVDYVGLPFQASQSFLHGIQPVNGNGWTEEGRKFVDDLVKNRIILATIAAYTQEGIPLVNLYIRNYNQYDFINEKLVEMGHAKWISMPEHETAS